MISKNTLITDTHLLIIGGTGRNIGKTTLALNIIKNLQAYYAITCLKVSAFRQGEEKHHGEHNSFNNINNFLITEENNQIPSKDTSRMLSAGAKSAYYIQSNEKHIADAFHQFKQMYYTGGPIICESRSLRQSIKPGLFIFITGNINIKNDIHEYQEMADYIHNSDLGLSSLERLANKITYDSDGWHINNY